VSRRGGETFTIEKRKTHKKRGGKNSSKKKTPKKNASFTNLGGELKKKNREYSR